VTASVRPAAVVDTVTNRLATRAPAVHDMFSQFKEFIRKGNVVELGVAFVLGVAFKTIVDAFAGDGNGNPGILGSLIGIIFGGETPNFGDRGVTINGSFVPVGSFVTALLNFVVVSVVLFVVIKAYNRIRRPDASTPDAPTELDLLVSIRDELRRSNDVADNRLFN
jgi:large conductance mechanosensitive channel